jgi:hypothetical protein
LTSTQVLFNFEVPLAIKISVMKKIMLVICLLPGSLASLYSQNVGIGTTSPEAKLEIRNALKADVKIRSTSFNDTSQVVLSNRSGELGTDFNIRSIREQGLFISSSSDLPEHNHDNTMVIHPQGRVGIGGLPVASAILDISSTNKGVLVPRLTTAQRTAIVSPATGLLVFDSSTGSFWFYSAMGWTQLVGDNTNSQIHDADNDTRVETEKNTDDDTIRFVSKGFELARITSKTLHMDTAGSIYIGNLAGQMDGGIDDIGNAFTGNVAIGRWAGQYSINGSNNVFVGYGAGRYERGKWNTYLGYNAGNGTLVGTNFQNTFVGRFAGGSSDGNENIHIGTYAGAYNNGSENIFIGNSTGGGTFVGSDRGSNNVVLGHSAGAMNIFGSSHNVLIGNNVAQTDTFSHRLYIHNGACDSTTALIYGKFDSTYIRVNGNIQLKNEMQTPGRTGNANMIPICYGNITPTGTINTLASTNNFTVSKSGTGLYLITIANENYLLSQYTAVVTPIASVPRFFGTSSGGGNLQVRIWDTAGALVDDNFQFIVYKK